ncbi:MAG: glycosyltransferase family 39 protein, partial [Candidatus Methanomethylophilaceae archaeon]|nr:glycosyltransferase family 39 protein [Candidatus Methanomethylophilaceae archaeon]
MQNHGALAVCIVALLALVLRTAFAYGVSADGNYALSGGSDAQYHLHVVESILTGSFIIGNDVAINYPVGGLNINPPLYDFIAAGIGSFGGASFALAVLAPIFGALTVFPVYLIAKELKGVKVGVLAALIYALMALPISSSVFSNGNEFAFTAFLLAFFILAMIKMSRKLSDDMPALREAVIAGILLGLIALSWNGFRSILVLLIIVMVIQLLIDRFNSKDFTAALCSYSIVMVIGVVLAAIYYIPAGLWDAVFSGPVLITLTAVVFGFIFKAVQSKPWIFTVPALIVAYAIVAAVLFLIDGDLGKALLLGNSTFVNPIMEELANLSVSISTMSSYYGWILMWMPFAVGIYEFYVYARKDRSNSQLFLTMFMLIPWFFAWTSVGAAAVAGPVFAVSSAMAIVFVLTKADLRSYWSNMKAAGFPGLFRKMIKPLPFVSVLVAAFLVVLPGCVYAVDAGISSNETYGYFAYGNTTYTIQTGDAYPMSQVYDDLTETADKDLGVLTWINNSTDITALGFNAVNDRLGTGATASSHIYLAEGSAGATAAQAIRVMIANPDTSFSAAFAGHADVYNEIAGYIADPETAVDEVKADTSVYGQISSDVTEENAVYFASIKAMTDNMSSVEIMKAYDSICAQADEKIGYYIIDGSMVPLVYGDGDSLATMAYFGGYSTDSYGAATQFYSLITYYSNYYPAMGTDALYDTVLWKALIGPSPADM